MRRSSSSPGFEIVVKAPTLGLNTRIPGRKIDPRAATAASNVRFDNGVASNAPGYGMLVTNPVLPKVPVLFQQFLLNRGGRALASVVLGTQNKLYSVFRYPESYTPFVCFAGDPKPEIPNWASLAARANIDPSVDVYGALGPEELRSTASFGLVWQVCDNIAYCDGPTEEGATMVDVGDRYTTRWVAKLEDGNIYYRRVIEDVAWTQVPNELILQPNPDLVGLGFSFDANAKPCFASTIGDNVHVYHYQGGFPTEQTFAGKGPRLFFTGIFQPDDALWDIVCYYCNSGGLAAAFQRDNFASEYVLFSDDRFYFTRVNIVDRGVVDEGVDRQYIAATGDGNFYGLFRTSIYAHWPVYVNESVGCGIAVDDNGRCSFQIVAIPAESDAVGIGASVIDDGRCETLIVVIPPEADAASAGIEVIDDGACRLQIVAIPLEEDSAGAYITVQDNGECETYVVLGGTYSDSTTASLTVIDDGHCTT